MAKIFRREWASKGPLGKRVRHVMYGYDLMVNGKRERKSSSAWTTEEAALKALSERQDRVRAGQTDRPADVTLGQAVDRYLKFKAAKHSLENDRFTFEKQLLPFFGPGLPLRRLTVEKIAAFEERRMTQVSVYTVRNELACLRHLLRLSYKKWKYINDVPEIEMPKAPKGRTRFLNEQEIPRLLEACSRSKNKHLRAIVTLAINTGMRKGEIMGLTWERVDLARDMGFGATITLNDTKNGEPRGVPLNKQAVAALASVEPDHARREGRVFKRSNGDDYGAIRTAWELALARAGIKNFRFHDLRHTCASYLTMRGRPMKEIQEVLGHKSLAMTLKYSHLSPKHLRTAVESLDGLTPIVSLDEMTHKMAHNRSADEVTSLSD